MASLNSDVSYVLEIARTRVQFYELAEDWNRLWQESDPRVFYGSFDFARQWVDNESNSPELRVTVVRDSARRVVGIVPLYIGRAICLGTVRYSVLRLIGDGRAGYEYGTWLIDRARASTVARFLAASMPRIMKGCAGLWMPCVAGWSHINQVVRTELVNSGLALRLDPLRFAAIDLPQSFDAYMDGLSAGTASQLARIRRRFQRSGHVARRLEDRSDVSGWMEAMFRLHQRSRGRKAEEGIFGDESPQRHYFTEAALAAFDGGQLAMYALFDGDGEIRAVQMGFVNPTDYFQVQEGFDPDAARGGGNLLRLFAIEDLIARGLSRYDFMQGHDEHKRRWQGVLRKGFHLLIYSPGALGTAIRFVGGSPGGRRLVLY